MLEYQGFDFMEFLDIALTSNRDQITEETLNILKERYINNGSLSDNNRQNQQAEGYKEQHLG